MFSLKHSWCRVGVTKPIFSVIHSLEMKFPKHWLPIKYHIHIWQGSTQLCCGDPCQIWMWCKRCDRYLCKILNRIIDKCGLSAPHLWCEVLSNVSATQYVHHCQHHTATCWENQQLQDQYNLTVKVNSRYSPAIVWKCNVTISYVNLFIVKCLWCTWCITNTFVITTSCHFI